VINLCLPQQTFMRYLSTWLFHFLRYSCISSTIRCVSSCFLISAFLIQSVRYLTVATETSFPVLLFSYILLSVHTFHYDTVGLVSE
jgi:hypothetical protein